MHCSRKANDETREKAEDEYDCDVYDEEIEDVKGNLELLQVLKFDHLRVWACHNGIYEILKVESRLAFINLLLLHLMKDRTNCDISKLVGPAPSAALPSVLLEGCIPTFHGCSS